MYGEFLYIILDYISTLSKREAVVEWGIPIVLGLLCAIINPQVQYGAIADIVPFLGILLGFSIASLTFLLSNKAIRATTQLCSSKRKIRGKVISLYKLLVVYLAYSIAMEAVLCIAYYIGKLFAGLDLGALSIVVNTVFLILALNVLLTTIKMTTALYFIVFREQSNSNVL